jgi:hypothetical protein
MRSSMISKVTAGLIATVFAVAPSAPAAQAQDGGFAAKVNVPFAFQIASGQHFAPGVYTIRMNGLQSMLIRSSTAAGLTTTQLANDGQPATQGKAVFTHYGDHYFLHAVWVAGNASHLIFDTSKSERQSQISAGKTATPVELALLSARH